MASTETESQPKATKAQSAKLARDYFQAIGIDRDLTIYDRLWDPKGSWQIYGRTEVLDPAGARAFFTDLYASVPDMRTEVLDVVAEAGSAAVRWRITGTFAGTQPLDGIKPNGARLVFEGIDLLTMRGDKIVSLIGYADNMDVARQIGVLPPAHSGTEQRMTRAFNAKTKLGARLASAPERIADGVWVVRGRVPFKDMNVYLLEDGDGLVVFDAGIKAMTHDIAAAGAAMGGIRRVVLGHGHPDHRGAAAGLGVPVYCHPAERADAQSDGGHHYFDFSQLRPHARFLMPKLLKLWDGGPVEIEGTVEEGDDVAGFRVVHLPGHAPGLIGLWRESDRLALVSDCFYTLDPQTGKHGAPRVPHAGFNQDTEQARASIRKLAAMDPATAWAGHAEPVAGDVRAQLETAAST